MELMMEREQAAFPRIFSARFFILIYFFIALFPVLSSGHNHLSGRSNLVPLSLPYPAFLLLLVLFVPVFLRDIVLHKGRSIMEAFRSTTWVTFPVAVLGLVVLIYSLHPDAYWEKGFDLVITDQTMPEMTGAELAKEIIGVRADIPIIMCTGFSHVIDADSAKAAGIREFVMKPLTKREIARTIRQVLDG